MSRERIPKKHHRPDQPHHHRVGFAGRSVIHYLLCH